MERRLAAILVSDVASYSRLMGEDEAGTLAALKAHRAEFIDPKIAEHHGRIVKLMGDGALVEFASVVDAVACAVAIQRGMAERNAEVSEEQRMEFRMGVNLGDVIVEGDDIYGDGVNVAARLQELAKPGGVCIGGTVFDQVESKLDLTFDDLGEQRVKNIGKPVRVYSVSFDEPRGAAVARSGETLPLPDKPSIAVLPFTNMSGDPEQEYFSDGITEDIITALSYWRSFPVIARNSTFAFKGKAVDVKQVARDLGARYVLEGSVRKAGDRVRITAQLVDATTGHHIWAEKYDRKLEDIFDLQDEITQRIVATVEPQLEQAEQKRSVAKKPKNFDAWSYYQRGMSFVYEFTKEGNTRAREMFDRALELDSTYSQAFAGLAYSYHLDILLEHSDDREDAIVKLREAARRAVALDDTDAFAHFALGNAFRWSGQHEMAVAEAERAVEINPSAAWAHAILGNVLDLAGKPEEGIPKLEKGLQLNPRDPRIYFYMTLLARAHLNARRYEDAVEWARRAIHRRPDHSRAHTILAISLAHLGRRAEARAALDECERVQPGFAEKWARLQQFRNPADNEHILDGLRKAGLPE